MRALSVRAIVMKDNKLLCVKLKNYRSKARGDFWCLPGGGVDKNEAVLPALEREITEETGIIPKIGKLLYINQFLDNEKDILELFFHVTNTQDFLNIDLSKSSHGQEEIEEVDFIDPAKARILPEFLTADDIQSQIKNNQPVKIFSY